MMSLQLIILSNALDILMFYVPLLPVNVSVTVNVSSLVP